MGLIVKEMVLISPFKRRDLWIYRTRCMKVKIAKEKMGALSMPSYQHAASSVN